MASAQASKRLYVGVDVGGTKIQASLLGECGRVHSQQRRPTPRGVSVSRTVREFVSTVTDLLRDADVAPAQLAGIGVAVPGVVDPDGGTVVFAPNLAIGGSAIVERFEKAFGVQTILGNDCNLAALGVAWCGAGRGCESVAVVLPGTGIGGGFVRRGELWTGSRQSAMEIGHMVMEIGGPKCGCGNRGCLEAIASRTAMERDIRAAVARGESTVLTDLLDGDLGVIRSSMFSKALAKRDTVVTHIVRHAAEVLGHACVNVRHLLDPEVIVLGGGVIEACGSFMLPTIERIVAADKLPGSRENRGVRLSSLGDDAVVLGALAAVRLATGRSPFEERFHIPCEYPEVSRLDGGALRVGGEERTESCYIRVNGKAKKLEKIVKTKKGGNFEIGPAGLAKVCRGGPQVLFLGSGGRRAVKVCKAGEEWLRAREIELVSLPVNKAIEAYNGSAVRRAAVLQLPAG